MERHSRASLPAHSRRGTKKLRSNEDARRNKKDEKRKILLLIGRVLGAVGMLLAVVGFFRVFIAPGALASFLGVAGYSIGARRLGFAAIVLGVVSILVAVTFGRLFFGNLAG
jgi:small-conductance mechanosensitive channel